MAPLPRPIPPTSRNDCGAISMRLDWCDEVACLVAGTLIETEQCARPIEDLIPGDLVWTRGGLRRVAAAGPTRFNAPLWCLRDQQRAGTCRHRQSPDLASRSWLCTLQFVRENDILAPWCPKLSRGVVNAGISSGRTTPELSAVREFAVTDIDPHVISVTKLNDRGIVYNLDVEGEHGVFRQRRHRFIIPGGIQKPGTC